MRGNTARLLIPGPINSKKFYRAWIKQETDKIIYALYSYENGIEAMIGFGELPAGLHDTVEIFMSHTKINKAISVLRAWFSDIITTKYLTSLELVHDN